MAIGDAGEVTVDVGGVRLSLAASVAARLYLAEKTIKNYVTSVLSKMGMARRTEAAVYAATHLDKAKRDQPSS